MAQDGNKIKRKRESKMADNKLSMDIHEILDHLPHRYPFVLVDKVIPQWSLEKK